jgi:gamma-glutamyltranspeptidase/glutathione hydrolase
VLGATIRQPELAQTLELLASRGLEAFYRGDLAARLVAGVRAQGGNWTEADLAGYRVVERQPIVGHYRGARIVSAPPPSSGGIALPSRFVLSLNRAAQRAPHLPVRRACGPRGYRRPVSDAGDLLTAPTMPPAWPRSAPNRGA